ncbi:putative leucine-rich repeat-containing protein DDB_G0290503 [Diorhabda carinulata]|uniref:putative leucine-rich repeat-containing protein DDB_G0290503 n=1 Tax=Diorhabda carinulata TaxID=1163345 RepID=UPI0025A1A652|nr:putative leucine-rich repeat-containing protein DDB_G0290503 [Diorhabda carinulata]
MEVEQEYRLETDSMDINYESENPYEQQMINEKAEPTETERELEKTVNYQFLNYKAAEHLIQKKCKEFVEVQEIQNNTSQVLIQKNMCLLAQIKKEQKIVDDLKFEAEKISTQEMRSRDEIVEQQRYVENAVEIKEKLEEFIYTLSSRIDHVNSTLEETFEKVANQKEMFEKNKTTISNIQYLQKALEDESSLKWDEDNSDKKENLRLKQLILERKNYLETAKARFEEGNKTQELNSQLKIKKEKLENKLKESKLKRTEIQNEIEQVTTAGNFILTNVQQEWETHKQRIISLENEISQKNIEIADTIKSMEKIGEILREERLKFDEIQSKTAAFNQIIAEMETKLNSTSKEHEIEIDNIKKKIEEVEYTNTSLNMENNKKMEELEQLVQIYSTKLEERNALIIQKETACKTKQLNLVNNELLDEQIKISQGKIQSVQEQTANISSEESIIELEKQNSYLETCKVYFDENKKILDHKKSEAVKTIDGLVKEINGIKNSIQETEKNLKELTKPLTGILKKGNQKRNASVRPKIVQFVNISSDGSNDACTSQRQAVYDKISADYAKLQGNKNKKKCG